MKKILLALIAIAMIFAITACSQDQYQQLGDLMGKMGNNVWGISPNLTDVSKASDTIDNAINEDGTVDLKSAAGILDYIASIKDSSQKTDALKESMAKPSGATAEKLAEAIKTTGDSLEAAIDDIDSDILSDEQKEALKDSLGEAISYIKNNIPENPTRGDVATVAVLDSMAQAVIDFGTGEDKTEEDVLGLVTVGMEALEALSLVSGYADIDMPDLLTGLLAGDRSVSRDDSDSPNVFVKSSAPMIRQIVLKLTDDEGTFNDPNYRRFVSHSKVYLAAYELIASVYVDSFTSISAYDALFSKNISGLNVDDFLRYTIVWLICKADYIDSNLDALTYSNVLTTYLSALIDNNYDVLLDLSHRSGEFNSDAMQEASDKVSEGFQDYLSVKFIEAMAEKLTDDEKTELEEDLNAMDMIQAISYMGTSILQDNEGTLIDFGADFIRYVGTSCVIIRSSNLDATLFNLAGVDSSAEGKVSAVFSNLFELLENSLDDAFVDPDE